MLRHCDNIWLCLQKNIYTHNRPSPSRGYVHVLGGAPPSEIFVYHLYIPPTNMDELHNRVT